ncbi:glutamine amidotransferase [Bordetella flabilis]|uniref:GMP synthase n=1 Tax=Bordetella flabilis TaxID=463014 RepID=A0A193GDX3_9BORD|nr:glutamine amidotransferase [Bordetella flabilis]ANN78232.1 GMP synthase [Bordetella flabilis]
MTATDLPILILHTGDPEESLRAAYGSYVDFICRTAGLSARDVQAVPVFLGEQPAAPDLYRAAFITGSPSMVTDREPWSEQAAQWLRDAAAHRLPMFGICYGHQLLAHALGGLVGYNPAGREIGTHAVEHLGDDPLLAGVPRDFPAQTMHAQSVMSPPPGAVVLARSAMDPHQMLRIGENIVTTQFHPEFSPEFVRAHLQRYADAYARENLDVAALVRGVRPTPHAAGLLRRFLDEYAPVSGGPSGTAPSPRAVREP